MTQMRRGEQIGGEDAENNEEGQMSGGSIKNGENLNGKGRYGRQLGSLQILREYDKVI